MSLNDETTERQLFEYRRELIQSYNEIKIMMIALDYPKKEINEFKKRFNYELFHLIYNDVKDVKKYIEIIDCLRERLRLIIKNNSKNVENKIIMNDHIKINNDNVVINDEDKKIIEREYYKIDGLGSYGIKECDDITKMMLKEYYYTSYQSICIYNINKYIIRHGFKNGKDDLTKSLYFIEYMMLKEKEAKDLDEKNYYFNAKQYYDLRIHSKIIYSILIKYEENNYKNRTLFYDVIKNMFKPNYCTNYSKMYEDVQKLIDNYK